MTHKPNHDTGENHQRDRHAQHRRQRLVEQKQISTETGLENQDGQDAKNDGFRRNVHPAMDAVAENVVAGRKGCHEEGANDQAQQEQHHRVGDGQDLLKPGPGNDTKSQGQAQCAQAQVREPHMHLLPHGRKGVGA